MKFLLPIFIFYIILNQCAVNYAYRSYGFNYPTSDYYSQNNYHPHTQFTMDNYGDVENTGEINSYKHWVNYGHISNTGTINIYAEGINTAKIMNAGILNIHGRLENLPEIMNPRGETLNIYGD